ncbi:MAG: STAS domain-containing protein [Phycisphaerales bacterium]|nr:STAS domain-containing protein [Phycisphaerales bacterium]
MILTSEAHRAATVICITGDLTTDDSDSFQREVRETVGNFSTNVIIDCTSLGLIDSVGLESLLWLSDELSRAGNKLRFASVPEPLERVFELTRLNRVFSSHESVEQAARSFA